MMQYRTLVADCPWKFGDSLPGLTRGAIHNYPVLSVDALLEFDLPETTPDAHLFFWRVASMQPEALTVVRAWGFTVKSELVWLKHTRTGKRWFGMGRQVRNAHEVCLICTKGRPPVHDRSVRSTFTAPVGRHSEKPDAFYDVVERLTLGPYCELFARRRRPGWTCMGDEL